MSKCYLCPRKCGADRSISRGYCGAGDKIEVSKIMLHHWEEPPISGYNSDIYADMTNERGSGAIFFTHCPLGCVYCQNSKISRTLSCGKAYSPDELAEEMLALEKRGAYNINLVSPTQYSRGIAEAVRAARERGLTIPTVYNTGGYELPEVIRQMKDTVDIYLTDFKYASPELSQKLSRAADYPTMARDSLSVMFENVGEPVIGGDGMMKRGIIVRHLVLPSHKDDSIAVLDMAASCVPPKKVLLSLMAQYTPDFLPAKAGGASEDDYREIRRKITTYEYEKVREHALSLGFDGFMQERNSATKRFTPDF